MSFKPGWYPLEDNSEMVDYWDGHKWAGTPMPPLPSSLHNDNLESSQKVSPESNDINEEVKSENKKKPKDYRKRTNFFPILFILFLSFSAFDSIASDAEYVAKQDDELVTKGIISKITIDQNSPGRFTSSSTCYAQATFTVGGETYIAKSPRTKYNPEQGVHDEIAIAYSKCPGEKGDTVNVFYLASHPDEARIEPVGMRLWDKFSAYLFGLGSLVLAIGAISRVFFGIDIFEKPMRKIGEVLQRRRAIRSGE